MRAIKTTTISILAVSLLAGSAVEVTAQDEAAVESATPVYFTWTAGEPASVTEGTFDESAQELRGLAQEGIPVEASDPRFSGLAHVAINGNQEIGTDTTAILESRSYRIVNDDGAWVGSSTFVLAADPSVDGPPAIQRETAILTGEGAYEGLTIVVTGDYREGTSGEGVIYEIGLPPVPDVPDAPAE